ncbi:hypothetical protein N6H14_26220 [Paenibacillus sp. CC-CFT747]|nr:hypothetical protein N6H14_26220 [Paenibacillus sp. CC-CFT747]
MVPDFYRGVYETSEETDRLVGQYLQKFAFTPTMDFKEWRMTDDLYATWPQLFQEIPQRIGEQLELIKKQLT